MAANSGCTWRSFARALQPGAREGSSDATAPKPGKALTLTPTFKTAAEAALDAIDAAGAADRSAEVVFAMQIATARGELNHAKREVRTRQDALAAQKLYLLFNTVNRCRFARGVTDDQYRDCMALRGRICDEAVAAIGAKTWKTIHELTR